MGRYRNKKYISKNGYTPRTNRIVGSLSYFIIHGLVFATAYYLWGFQMFGEPWFYAVHIVAFAVVKIILKGAGFWIY